MEADALVGDAANPTVANAFLNTPRRLTRIGLRTVSHVVLREASGALLPGRMTLLLGPPSSGKTVLLQALAGQLQQSKTLRVSGSVQYDGLEISQFQVRRVASLVEQRECCWGCRS